jgi:hypothetical protein
MKLESLSINGPILHETATEIALRLKEILQPLYNIVCGGRGSVDDTVENWKESLLGFLQDEEPKDIFNAHKTWLFYNMLSSKTFSMKGQPCHGGKESHNDLLCRSFNYTEKF